MTSWLFFALLSALLFGIAQVLAKKGLATLSPLWNCVLDAVITLLIYVPLALILGVSFMFTPIHFLTIIVITGLYLSIYYAIEKAQVSLSGTIFASYPVVTILLSYLFLQERVTTLQYGGMLSVLLGGILISYTPTNMKTLKQAVTKHWLLWALFGAVTTGLGDFMSKVVLNDIDITSYIFLFGLALPISVAILWIVDKKGRKLPKKVSFHTIQWSIYGAIGLSLGVLAISYAFAYGMASTVSVISTSYIALTVALAYIFLKERLTRNQLLGIVCVILGVVLIGI